MNQTKPKKGFSVKHNKVVESGRLIRIGSLERHGQRCPNVVKLYSSLDRLKTNSFMGFDKVFTIEPGDPDLVTMIIDTSCFDYKNVTMEPKIEAAKIILDHNTWWIFSYDIHEVIDLPVSALEPE